MDAHAPPEITPPPLISVIIVNYNGGAFLQEAVNSLSEQTFKDFELILVDNASADRSADTIDMRGIPSASLIRNDDNRGFAAANNQAAELARGRWLVLLNPDCIAAPDWLAALVEAASKYPGCRSFTSAQYNLADPSVIDGAGDAYSLFGIPWRGGFGRPASELPESGWCFSACGAGAMYDAETFRELGGFDERFFCYCEDVDLGFRLQLMGHDCRFVREAVVHHAGSGITGRTSPFTIYHGTRNRLWTYAKNMPGAAFWLTLPGHAALSLYLLLRSSFTPRFVPMLKGYRDGLAQALVMRSFDHWKVAKREIRTRDLLRRMAWNPAKLSGRRTDVRRETSACDTQILQKTNCPV